MGIIGGYVDSDANLPSVPSGLTEKVAAWLMHEDVTYWSDSGFRAFFLGLSGVTMETDVGTFVIPASGAETVINLPFTPDLVLVAGADSTESRSGIMSIGAIGAGDSQWGCSITVPYLGLDTSDIGVGWQKSGRLCIAAPCLGFTGFTFVEAVGAITANTLTISQDPGAPWGAQPDTTWIYLAIKDPGGEFKVGYGDMASGTSGMGRKPEAVLCATCWEPPVHDALPGRMTYDYPGCLSVGYTVDQTWETGTNLASVYCPTVPRLIGGGVGPGARFRSNSSLSTLVSKSWDGSIQNTLEASLVSDGFNVAASDPAAKYGWVAMRGSAQDGGCAKAGIFLSVGVDGANATEQAMGGYDPNGQGVSSMSIGFIGSDSLTQYASVYGSRFEGNFSDGGSEIKSAVAGAGFGNYFIHEWLLVAGSDPLPPLSPPYEYVSFH